MGHLLKACVKGAWARKRPRPRARADRRDRVPASVKNLVHDGVIRAKRGRGLEAGLTALMRAALGGKGTVVRIDEGDVAVLPLRYLELLERLVEEAQDRIDVETAERLLNDPTQVPVPFESVVRELGLGEVPD